MHHWVSVLKTPHLTILPGRSSHQRRKRKSLRRWLSRLTEHENHLGEKLKHVSPWPGKLWIQTNLGWSPCFYSPRWVPCRQVSAASQECWLATNDGLLDFAQFLPHCGFQGSFRTFTSGTQAFYIISLVSYGRIRFHSHWIGRKGALSGSGDWFKPFPRVLSNHGADPHLPRSAHGSHALSRTPSFCTTYGSRRKQRSPEPGPPETGTRRWRRFWAWWWASGPRSHSSWLTGSGWTPECPPTPNRARNRT